MSCKRPSDSTSASNTKKRKQSSLTIAKKVELLKKFDQGTSVHGLCSEFEIGKSTVYDLIKKKDEILSFFADSDSPIEMAKRKTIRGARNDQHDKVMIEWFKQRRSENVPLTGPMIMAQAIKYHNEMGLTTPCHYTTGWLDKFKKRHGIRQIRICGEKLSADVEAAEIFVSDLTELIEKENISLDQIYNADETALFWRYIPRKTFAMAEEKNPTGIKDVKERITILACANASGTHKLKLLVIGKSANPRAFKGMKTFPVVYKSNRRAWMTKEIFSEWYKNNFVPEVKKFHSPKNLNDEKIYLIVDNCSAHPDDESVDEINSKILFLPPNCTAILQPMDNGILRALKCRYKNDFLHRMLDTVNAEKSISDFSKEFNIRDALWCAANAWSEISEEILRHAWNNLLPQTLFIDTDCDDKEFGGFKLPKQKTEILNLMSYAKTRKIDLEESDIIEVLNCDDEAPTINKLTDTEIISSVLNTNENHDDEEDENDPEKDREIISTEKLIELLGTAIQGLEQKNFISEHEILSVYKIREKLIKHRPKMKQQTLLDMLKKC